MIVLLPSAAKNDLDNFMKPRFLTCRSSIWYQKPKKSRHHKILYLVSGYIGIIISAFFLRVQI